MIWAVVDAIFTLLNLFCIDGTENPLWDCQPG